MKWNRLRTSHYLKNSCKSVDGENDPKLFWRFKAFSLTALLIMTEHEVFAASHCSGGFDFIVQDNEERMKDFRVETFCLLWEESWWNLSCPLTECEVCSYILTATVPLQVIPPTLSKLVKIIFCWHQCELMQFIRQRSSLNQEQSTQKLILVSHSHIHNICMGRLSYKMSIPSYKNVWKFQPYQRFSTII